MITSGTEVSFLNFAPVSVGKIAAVASHRNAKSNFCTSECDFTAGEWVPHNHNLPRAGRSRELHVVKVRPAGDSRRGRTGAAVGDRDRNFTRKMSNVVDCC